MMSKVILLGIVSFLVILYLDHDQSKQTNFRLSNFVGHHAEAVWTEHQSTGEVRYYTEWVNCSAVIGEKNNVYYYITEPVCFNKPKEVS